MFGRKQLVLIAHQHFKVLVLSFVTYYGLYLMTMNIFCLFIIIAVVTDLHHPIPRWTENTAQEQVQRPFMVCTAM